MRFPAFVLAVSGLFIFSVGTASAALVAAPAGGAPPTPATTLPARFTPQNSAILLVDHQGMTVNWIKSQPRELVVANVRLLARLGAEMHIPLLVTSTMEANVGTNIEDIQKLAPDAYARRVKRGGTLNCFNDPAFATAVKALGRKNLVIAGLTTDICLMHTVEGALREGYTVQVVADACGAMTALADELTFDRLRALGVVVTVGNQILTELYPDFGTAEGQQVMKINLDEITGCRRA